MSFGTRSTAGKVRSLATIGLVATFTLVTPGAAGTAGAAGGSVPSARTAAFAHSDLPRATLPTGSATVDSRPASCPTLNNDPNTGSGTPSPTGQFPWPPAPAGTSAADWVADPHTPATGIPLRPANWSQGGGDVKLTSARSSDPALAGNPQELCGVEGNSVDTAWQTTTGRPSTLIAVADSGIEWCDPALVDKIYLNRDALPAPEDATGETKPELAAGGQQFADTDPYDLNGTGVFNVEQYSSDPRLSKPYFCATHNGDGFGYTGISPADLIAAFGTPGAPDDADRAGPAGFTDAIAGWNFVDDDNDPYDAVHYDHGTGTAEDATAAASTVAQEVGACPNCMVMPLKVGDSFVTSGNAFAEAALFAVDSGASVIQEALGTYDVTATDTQAITYAEDHGVPVVASAADEESEHHNLPAVLENTIVVNSVTHDSSFSPASYLYLNGCTNFGANISVSVESTSCSSEATGKTGGIVGLAESAAAVALADHTISAYPGLHTASGAPVALSANELTQLVTMSADDVDFDRAAPPNGPAHNTAVSTGLPLVSTRRDPTRKGFDPTSGYGRIDAGRLVQWIASGQIPPQAEVDGLPWYQVLSPSQSVTVSGVMGTSRSPSWRYEVQVAAGESPRQSAWRVVSSGSGQGVRTGELAQIPLSQVAALFPPSVKLDGSPATPHGQPHPDRFMFTIRVVVQDGAGMVGMARRTEFLHQDPSLVGGAPVHLPSSVVAPPVLAPIGPGGTDALLVATADGTVHAYGAAGEDLPGWPVRTGPDTGFHPDEEAYQQVTAPSGEIVGGLAVGDLADASGHDPDVVATDLTGRVWAWNAAGKLLPGWPVRTDAAFSGPGVDDTDNEVLRGILGAPVLGDLQGNGTLDVVAASMDRHVYAWQPDGGPAPGWPVEVVDPKEVQSVDPTDGHVTFLPGAGGDTGSKLVDTPAIAQLVPGGPPQVVVTSNEQYAGPPNASLGILGTLFALTGKLGDTANSRVYAIWPAGSEHPTTAGAPDPPGYPNPGAFLPGWPVAIADLDPDLLPDIGDGASNGPAVATVAGRAPLVAVQSDVGPVYLLRADGSDALGTTSGLPNVLASGPAGAKSNSAGILGTSVPALGVPVIAPFGAASDTGGPLDVLGAAESAGELLDVSEPAEQTPHDSQIDAWDAASGSFVAGFPQVMGGLQFFDQPLVADLTGAGGQAYAVEASSDSDLRAFDAGGREAPGFPKLTGGWVTGGAVFGRLGTMADQVLVAGTREGELFVWQTGAPATDPRGAWPQVHQDLRNTGDYSAPS
ncbi:MAG: S8 family serine peptidase [Acidimicrobiales bacterium]